MKRTMCVTLLVLVAVVGMGYLSGLLGDGAGVAAAPPLSLDGLMDEKLPEAPRKTAKMKADNFAYYVCHGNYKEKVIALWQKRCPKKIEPTKLVCTDCHFQHRLERRVVVWEKRTREVIKQTDTPAKKK